MAGDGLGQLGVTALRQPRRRALAMGEGANGIAGRQHLVRIVEQGRSLDEASVHGHAIGPDSNGEPAGHLGYGPCVTNEPDRRIQGEQEGGGLHSSRYRHLLDGTRQASLDPEACRPRPLGQPTQARARE